MKRGGTVLALAAILGGIMVPDCLAARRPKAGVFGSIHGKKFGATNVKGNLDPCNNGIYAPSTGTLVFSAIECKRGRRRQGVAVKKNYQIIVMACARYDLNASLVPPYEIPCPGSVYTEARTGRFGVPVSMMMWNANFEYGDNFVPTSNVRARIDAFDGTNVRGVIFGVFEVPANPSTTGTAPIDGELHFNFPIQVQ